MSSTSTTPDAAAAVMRLGLGAKPGELEAVAFDPRAWLHDQIVESGADQPQASLPASADGLAAVAAADMTPPTSNEPAAPPADAVRRAAADAAKRGQAVGARARELANAELSARAALACQTDAGFRERWTLFWTNHFSISADGAGLEAIAGAYEREAIRPHVFGRFEDLALAALKHPAMLMFYQQAGSAGPNSAAVKAGGGGMSENLGRESLELHTVGLAYTQADVHEMSLALTGWSVGQSSEPGANAFVFRPQDHEPGPRTIMGEAYADTGDGQADAIVRGLARRPETARHLAVKIARHFVADRPPSSHIDRLSGTYLASKGSLAAVAHALVDAPETWAPEAARFKSPYDLYISANRALGRGPGSPSEPGEVCATMEQPLFGAPTPAGWPDIDAAWASPSGLANRIAWLRTLDGGEMTDGDLANLARTALGPRLRPQTLPAINQTAWAEHRVALLFMSPEFQRR